MASFIDDIKAPFRNGNTLYQLMILNGAVLLFLMFFQFLAMFWQTSGLVEAFLLKNLSLSADLGDFIRKPWTLITYNFVHDGLFHLFFNMLTFFWFGHLIVDFIGNKKLLNIYLVGGIISGSVYVCVFNIFKYAQLPYNLSVSIVGSSASIFAVMFASVALVPEYEFFLFGAIRVKIKYLALFFLIFFSFRDFSSGVSHLAGAAIGYLYIVLLRKGIDLGTPIEACSSFIKELRMPQKKKMPKKFSPMKVSHKQQNLYPNAENEFYPDQSHVDSILDKINKSGYESLSKEEKQTLYRASQRKD